MTTQTLGRLVLAAAIALVPAALPGTAGAAARTPALTASGEVVLPSPPPAGTTGSVQVTALRNGATGSTPQTGVVFTLERVAGVDLTTTDGWAATSAYVDALGAPAGTTFDGTWTLPATDAHGSAVVTDLPLGLYRLSAPGWTQAYLTVPIQDATTPTAWDTTVAVYPKHELTVTDVPPAPGVMAPVPPADTPAPAPTPAPVVTPSTVPAPPATAPSAPAPSPVTGPRGPQGPAGPNGGAGASGPNGGAGASGPDGAAAASGPFPGSGVAGAVGRGLAYTGAELTTPLGIAGTALTLGTGLVLLARRRRDEDGRR